MSLEKPNKKEVKKHLTEEDIKERDKNRLWLAGAAALGVVTAGSEVGRAISNSLDNDLLTSESFSYKLDKPAGQSPKETEKVKVTLEGEEVASFEIPNEVPFEEN